MADAKLSGPDEKLFYQSRRLYRKCCNIYYIQVSMMVKNSKVTFRVHCSSYAFAFYTGYGYGSRCWSPRAMCQSAGVWQGLIKNICWSCIFPMRIMGIGAAPEGAAPSRPGCYCTDQNGVPEIGWQLSFFQPVKIVEVVKSPGAAPFLKARCFKIAV